MKKCPFCAEEIQDEAIKCKHCGEVLNESRPPKVVAVNTKKPEIAFMLSFLPGFGQFYNGQIGKGIMFLILIPLGSCLFYVPGLIIWIISAADAYGTAKRTNA